LGQGRRATRGHRWSAGTGTLNRDQAAVQHVKRTRGGCTPQPWVEHFGNIKQRPRARRCQEIDKAYGGESRWLSHRSTHRFDRGHGGRHNRGLEVAIQRSRAEPDSVTIYWMESPTTPPIFKGDEGSRERQRRPRIGRRNGSGSTWLQGKAGGERLHRYQRLHPPAVRTPRRRHRLLAISWLWSPDRTSSVLGGVQPSPT